jgi:thymidylate synthase
MMKASDKKTSFHHIRKYKSFDHAFVDLACHLADIQPGYNYETPTYVSAPRGMQIKEQLFASFLVEDPRNRLLAVPDRKFSTEYLAAELIWYLSGNNKLEWIGRHASFWQGIANADKTVNSAYGHRIFLSRGGQPSQWERVKAELEKDPDSRRAVIHIKSESDSLESSDVPCTMTLQFFIRNKKLHLQTHMRSNDLILGLSYDLPAFTLMQELMALDLDLELGSYCHSAGSLHVYERHYEMLNAITHTPLSGNYGNVNAEGNRPMNRIAAKNSTQVLNEARRIADWDLSFLEKCLTSDEAMSTMLRMLEKLEEPLMRDCVRLLTTSFLRRFKSSLTKEIGLTKSNIYIQDIDIRRENIVKGIEDTALRNCTR